MGSEEARYDSCYYEVSMDTSLLEEWIPKKLMVHITDKSPKTNAYIYGGIGRKEATQSLKSGN